MARHKFTQAERRRGGLTTAALPGGACQKCGRTYATRLALIGHKGLHTFADRYAGGDMRAAARKFVKLGHAASDPFPGNGAFAQAHRIAAEVAQARAALVGE